MRKTLLLSLLFLLFLIGFLSGPSNVYAQGDPAAQWKVFSIPVPFDPFFSRLRPLSSFAPFFLDSVRGYARWQSVTPGDSTGNSWYTTDDGGESWERYYTVPPPAHSMKGEFGVANDGKRTTDGGKTWRSFYADSTFGILRLVYGEFPEQGLPQVMAAFVDPNTPRLAFTTDGGTTWTYADRYITRPDRNDPDMMVTVLNDTTLFGIVPTDSSTGYFRWASLLGINGDTLFVTTRKVGVSEVADRADEFWAINLRTGTARHRTMDTLARLALNNLQRSPFGLLYAWNYPSGQQSYFARSTDEGGTWNFAVDYPWADFSYFRFLSPTYGVSINAITTDGGVTWRKWGSQWNILSFFAADSLHWYGITDRHFLRSTDGGESWRIAGNENLWMLDEVDAMYAWKKKVILGSGAGNLLVSADSAENWVNLRNVSGSLPAEFTRLRAVAVPDTAGDPDRVIALASFYDVDSGSSYAAVMESEDAGMNWRIASLLPEFDSAITGSWAMQFVPNGSGEGVTGFLQGGNPSMLYRSSDGGRSWQFVTDEFFSSLAMADDRYGVAGREGALLRTTDGGLSWTVTRTYTAPLRFVYGLTAFDRDRYAGVLPNNLQIPYQWRPIHSGDGGASWSLLGGRTFATNDPGYLHWRSPGEVYSLSQIGLLYSSDSGKGFAVLHSGLPWAENMGVISDGSYLYQFSADSAQVGRWRIQDFASSVHGGDNVETEGRLTVTILELPVRDRLRLRYTTPGSAPVTGGIYDTWGRRVLAVPSGNPAGKGILEIDVSGLASGTYFLRLSSEGKEYVRQVPVVR